MLLGTVSDAGALRRPCVRPVARLDRRFTAEVVASATGDFRFFAAPGTWTLRALSSVGTGDVTVSPEGPGRSRARHHRRQVIWEKPGHPWWWPGFSSLLSASDVGVRRCRRRTLA